MVYLFVLHRLAGKCTKIYNTCRTVIVRLIKPLVLQRFRCRCGLGKISAVVVYKKSRCRLISVLFASIFEGLRAKRAYIEFWPIFIFLQDRADFWQTDLF